MRTHSKIIDDAGAGKVHQHLAGSVSIHTVRSWRQRNAIPAQHWVALVGAGFTSLQELAEAAALPANDSTPTEKAA